MPENKELRPLQLARFSESAGLELVSEDVDELGKLLEQNRGAATRELAVLSVAGAFRRGKSFLLNFMVKFLAAKGEKISPSDDWVENDVNQGFKWANGSKRDTVGIWVWPQLFPITDQVSLLLLDTQGVYDTAATEKESAVIFALSALLSSVQVYNIHERIISSDLDHLQVYLEVGQCAVPSSSSGEEPHQQMCFLIRDWKFPQEDSYGFEGGKQVLDRALTGTDETLKAKAMLERCFISPIECFLLPHPGDAVSSSSEFKGSVKDMRPEFVTNVGLLLARILAPEYVQPKLLSGQPMTGKRFTSYLRSTVQALSKGTKDLKLSLFEILKSNDEHEAIKKGKYKYTTSMDQSFNGTKRKLWTEEFADSSHQKAVQEVCDWLRAKRLFGEEEGGEKGGEKGKEAVIQMMVKECEILKGHYANKACKVQQARESRRKGVKKTALVASGVTMAGGLACVSTGASLGVVPMLVGGGVACLGGVLFVPLLANMAVPGKPMRAKIDPPCYKVADTMNELACTKVEGGEETIQLAIMDSKEQED